MMNELLVREKFHQFLQEDVGYGDRTCASLGLRHVEMTAHIVSKADGIFCGEQVIRAAWGKGATVEVAALEVYVKDGARIQRGQRIATVTADAETVLTRERTVLNLIGRMCGIATMTRAYADAVVGTNARVCDTRKTQPGLAMFDKYAVTVGGGFNHRFGLYDAILIKENHLAAVGSLAEAVTVARKSVGHMIKIEVEVETEQQLLQCVEAGADVIMIDNQSPETVAAWRTLVPAHIVVEASGGLTLETIGAYAKSGADYLSVGALTHSVQVFDLSLLAEGAVKGEKIYV
ncbi:MAG: carboxylating nicotinate-nucleotide diphosphorylase [Bacilli bacterium]